MRVTLREQAIIRDGLLPAREMAKLLGVSTKWLTMLAADGHIPPADRGHYPLRDTVRGFARYYRRRVKSKASAVDRAEIALMQARTREIELRCEDRERRLRDCRNA